MPDQSTRFAASEHPGREKVTFECPTSLFDEISECSANGFQEDIGLSRAEIIRAALSMSLPLLTKHPYLVKLINQNLHLSNQYVK